MSGRHEHDNALSPEAVTDSGAAVDQVDEPGAAMRQVAGNLAAQGFEVRFPEWESSRRLTIINLTGATCQISVYDGGAVVWEYRCHPGSGADAGRVAALALRLLTDASASCPTTSAPSNNVEQGLQSIVGRQLQTEGMDVSLDICADQICFEVTAAIVVTNPDRPDRGEVRVGDKAALLWQTGCCETVRDDAETITDTIIAILTEDIEQGYVQRIEPGPASNGQQS